MGELNAETAEWYAKKYGECATNRLAVDALEVSPEAVSDVKQLEKRRPMLGSTPSGKNSGDGED